MRTVICGGPKTGKTTAATLLRATGAVVHHTDELIPLGWPGAIAKIVHGWFAEPDPWVVEGVVAAAALGRWMELHTGAPCDQVILRMRPLAPRTVAQVNMSTGILTTWLRIRPELARRGVLIDEGKDRR